MPGKIKETEPGGLPKAALWEYYRLRFVWCRNVTMVVHRRSLLVEPQWPC